MCGIVCYYGQSEGVTRVLEALHLLEYRAPDSSGLAVVNGSGELRVSRSVGSPARLVARLAAEPLYAAQSGDRASLEALLYNQALKFDLESLRDLSPENGYAIDMLYQSGGFSIGVGDRGSRRVGDLGDPERRFSKRMLSALSSAGLITSPDFDRDPVRHAFRILGVHVASREKHQPAVRKALDDAFLARIPEGTYHDWRHAWEAECLQNTPGCAFAVAMRHFQERFPGLSACLDEGDWERFGGLTARAMAQVVLGHGRWAMVGAVTESNAHPFLDRSATRAVCENGSHNASLLLGVRSEQDSWWRDKDLPLDEPVHTSDNTTEVIVYEWERVYLQLQSDDLRPEDHRFLEVMKAHGVADLEEQALRIALHRLTEGNAHACAFYGLNDPGVLYVSSHRKPIAIAMRELSDEGHPPRYEIMVASDVNAALMLWPGGQVDAVEHRVREIRGAVEAGEMEAQHADLEIDRLLDQFTLDVFFLDSDLHPKGELLAQIRNEVDCGQVRLIVRVSRYDGTEVVVKPQRIRLNPAMVGKGRLPTYTESHIAEIPAVLEELIKAYVSASQVRLDAVWADGQLHSPGLNVSFLRDKFGAERGAINRLLLVGEGSSWRDALAAAPLFRTLLPETVVNVYRPVEVLNLGEAVNPDEDVAVEISWSGTTDSLLKVDDWLSEMGVMRLGVTGRPQSDLGRRTSLSGGTINVHSGVEVSVATVKGYHAILTTLSILAIQLAQMQAGYPGNGTLSRLVDELRLVVPRHVTTVIQDERRRERIRRVAARCRDFNKVAVIGDSPVDVEAELKIEELAQVVANALDFNAESLRALIERTAFADEDRQRTLFIVNATTPQAIRAARPVVSYLQGLEVFCIVHATPHGILTAWERNSTTEVFVSPQVSNHLQPLIDAPFFFDLAVALAYARGLSPHEIDRPRNLAKSVTTTGAERRVEVESRHEFTNVGLDEFCAGRLNIAAWDPTREIPSRAALRATVALRAALAYIREPMPEQLALDQPEHLIVVTDTEATENAARMAATAWHDLLGVDLTVYRRFISELPLVRTGTAMLRLIRAGAVLSVQDPHTIALPSDMSPLQWELLGSVYLISLAVRLAREQGLDTSLWECGLAQVPLVVDEILDDAHLATSIRAILEPFVHQGYDKMQIIGGGQDFAAATSIARSLRASGFMAEALYTDSAWHGPLATVGGGDADHDTLILILATDPLFQPAALVDTQVYRTRNAPVILIVPKGNQNSPVVQGVGASAVLAVPPAPRPFVPLVNVALGRLLARSMAYLWGE